MNRRDFLMRSGAVAALSSVAPAWALARSRIFGINLFSVPKMLEQDFEKAIAFLAGLGYREVETFGPYTFSDPKQIATWKTITPNLGFSGSGFFGHSLPEARAIFKRHGISVPSMHTDLLTLQSRMGHLAEAAHALGATYVTLPSIPAEHRRSLDDFKQMAEVFNKIGEDAAAHGVRFAYHNHGYGLKPLEGQIPINLLIESTSPAHVFLELDIFWTVAGGADPVHYLSQYRGRYKMIHLKDMKKIHHFSGDGGTPDQWISMFPYLTYLGDGQIDVKSILAAAEKTGVEHYFVEQDNSPNPDVSLKGSADYLKNNGFK